MPSLSGPGQYKYFLPFVLLVAVTIVWIIFAGIISTNDAVVFALADHLDKAPPDRRAAGSLQQVTNPSPGWTLYRSNTGVAGKSNPTYSLSDVPVLSTLDGPLRILVWNKRAFGFLSRKGLGNCSQQCVVTHDREEYNKSEAVFFRLFYVRPSEVPRYKLRNQKWIYFTLEPPFGAWKSYKAQDKEAIREMFSVSSTYASDSDVPYNAYPRKCTVDEANMKKERRLKHNYALNKPGKAVWFVSACETRSKRESYVKELRKTVPVDVYGRCGNFSCPKENGSCDDILNQYKFYLSFENAICNDYATEKLRKILQKHINVLPIVLGGANYSKILPRDSYVDVKDFHSPAHLGQFLQHLDKNDTLFNHFMLRKKSLKCSYELTNEPNPPTAYSCRVCKFLHANRKNPSLVNDVVDYWSERNQCLNYSLFYKNVFDKLSS